MDGIPSEWLIAGAVALILAVALVIWKFGKYIVIVLVAIAILVVAAAVIWVLGQIQKPDVIPSDTAETIGDVADIARVFAPKEDPAPVYVTPTGGGGRFVAGVLTALVVLALGVGVYFYVRWRMAERAHSTHTQAARRSQRQWMGLEQQPTVIYLVGGAEEDDAYYDDAPLDWEDEWIGELFQS